MQNRVINLAVISLVGISAVLGVSSCSKSPTMASALLQPLHATGQTNTQPPVIIDVTLMPGTTANNKQPITGTFTATPVGGTSFSGSVNGTVDGTFDLGGNGGNFDGTVTSTLDSGCVATRPYKGPLTRSALTWVGQAPTNNCGGASPLTFDVSLPVTAAPPEPLSPSVDVAPKSASLTNVLQTGTAQVTANTTWSAASNQTWLTISAGSSGGAGTTPLTYQAQANSGPGRSATITIAHGSTTATLKIDQAGTTAGPVLQINPTSATVGAAAQGGYTATVTASNLSSNWSASATSTGNWLSVTGGSSGTNGSTPLTYSAGVNPGAQRTGTITVSGGGATPQTLTVTQQGTGPTLQINPTSATVGAAAQGGYTASVTGANLTSNWTASATSTGNWLSVTGGSTGNNGPTTLTYSVGVNPGAQRTGTITVSGGGATPQTLTVTQQGTGPTLQINPTSATVGAAAQGGYTASVTGANLTSNWTASATSTGNWLSVTGGSTGNNGPTTLTYSVGVNPAAQRTGTITVSGGGATAQTLTVTQQAAPTPTLQINPTSATVVAAQQGGYTATVTGANLTGNWTALATSTGNWLSITPPNTGGNGPTTLTYSALANPGAQRNGTITISATGAVSQTLTVTQLASAGACTSFSVTPDKTTVVSGQQISFDVRPLPTGCLWTARQGDLLFAGSVLPVLPWNFNPVTIFSGNQIITAVGFIGTLQQNPSQGPLAANIDFRPTDINGTLMNILRSQGFTITK